MRAFPLLRAFPPFGATLRRFARAREGGVAAITAGGLVAFVCAAALAVDWGSYFVAKRNLQAMADMAALAAAQNTQDAERAVRVALADHDLPQAQAIVQVGRYVADPALPPSERFSPSSVGANAARVHLQIETPVFLGRVFSQGDSVTLTAVAVARRSDQAAFSVGSRLLALRGGLANALLGALLGARISLTAVDYDSLLGAEVGLLGFLDALASEIGLEAGTYEELLATEVAPPALLRALAAAADPGARAALTRLAADASRSRALIPMSSLIAVAPGENIGVTAIRGLGVSVSALDAVFAVAQVANGERQVAVDIGAQVPGVADAQLVLLVGERPVGSGWINVGSAATRVQTAQVRLKLNVRVGVSRLLEANVPVYVQVASAEAELAGIACPWSDPAQTRVSVDVRPSVVEAWIGRMTPSYLSSMTEPFRVSEARIVNAAGLVSVDASSSVRAGALRERTLVFDARDIDDGRVRTVASDAIAQTLVSSLVGDLNLRVSLLGGLLSLGLDENGVKRALTTALTPVGASLDVVLGEVTSLLGLSIGEADVKVGGVWCGRSVLVQ